MKDVKDVVRRRPWIGWVLFIATIIVVVLIGLLTTSILERRTEAQYLDRKKIPIQPLEPRTDPEVVMGGLVIYWWLDRRQNFRPRHPA